MFIWIRSTKELLYVVGGAAALVFEYVEEEEPFSIIYGVSYKVSPY